jgi:hypothetical protein
MNNDVRLCKWLSAECWDDDGERTATRMHAEREEGGEKLMLMISVIGVARRMD